MSSRTARWASPPVAAALLEEARATSRRVLAAGHPGTLRDAGKLALTYTEMGGDAEAAGLHALYNYARRPQNRSAFVGLAWQSHTPRKGEAPTPRSCMRYV